MNIPQAILNRCTKFSKISKATRTMANKCKTNDYAAFHKVLGNATNIVALSGAGVSAESGIPVFRGAGGLWRTHRSTDLASPHAFRANPSLVWEFYHYRREVAFNSEPNNAHLALAKFEAKCAAENRNFWVVTQNVDGLHTKAGSKNVVELHGSLRKIKCTKCNFVETNIDSPICEALRGRGDLNNLNEQIIPINDLPKCTKCKSLVRPFIVWFGESLDRQDLDKARNLIETCDLCLVIGTSSTVMPASMFAPLAHEMGKPVAEFNVNEFPASDDFEFHFAGPCGTTIPKALGME